jgi:hypothetical protein
LNAKLSCRGDGLNAKLSCRGVALKATLSCRGMKDSIVGIGGDDILGLPGERIENRLIASTFACLASTFVGGGGDNAARIEYRLNESAFGCLGPESPTGGVDL